MPSYILLLENIVDDIIGLRMRKCQPCCPSRLRNCIIWSLLPRILKGICNVWQTDGHICHLEECQTSSLHIANPRSHGMERRCLPAPLGFEAETQNPFVPNLRFQEFVPFLKDLIDCDRDKILPYPISVIM